jgi:hypothetical protein
VTEEPDTDTLGGATFRPIMKRQVPRHSEALGNHGLLFPLGKSVTKGKSGGWLVGSPRENGSYFDPGRTHVVSLI